MHSNDCPADDELLAYSAGDLSEQVKGLIAGHVDSCASCESKIAAFRQDGTAVLEPAPTLDEAPKGNESEAGTYSDVVETYEFQRTLDLKSREEQSAQIDQTIESKTSHVATSGDATGFVDLNRLLEAKRGRTAPFKAERTLAQGGMGAVLVGQDKALQRQVAIKVMKPKIAESDDHRARFLEEAQITGQLEHPNIVPIHDLGKDAEGNLYFTMKLVKGQSLGQILAAMKQDGTGRSMTELLNITLKIADGLAFAHSKGVVHRDLKPDNVMVGDFGEVLVMDWGLAKLLGSEREAIVSSPMPSVDIESDTSDDAPEQTIKSVRATDLSSRTVDGTIQGTPSYMPPEQARGKIDEIDQRSDVYSLGAILYEILTLERPVEGETMSQLVKNAAKGNVIRPEERTPDRIIPVELSAVVMKAMQFAREDRYQTVKEFEQDIDLFLEGRAVSAKEDSLSESVVKLIRRNKAVSGAVAVAATIILALASFSYVRITGERDRAVENEQAASDNAVRATRNERRALASEQEARDREQEARASEIKAIEAERQQRETALAAAKQFALQTVELANVNQLAPATRRAKDAEIVAPGSPWQYFALGAIAMARVDYGGATELFQMALSQPDGDQPEIRAALADVLAREGSLAEAEAVLKDLDRIDDWRILLSAGRVLYDAQNWDACQQPLARAINLMQQEKDRPDDSFQEASRLLDAAPAQKACEGFYDEVWNLPIADLRQRVFEKIKQIHEGRMPYLELSERDDGTLFFGSAAPKWGLRHLYPLRGLPIAVAQLGQSSVWDISPLKGMPLKELDLSDCTSLTNLWPLKDSKSLITLNCRDGAVTDLEALRNLQLKELICYQAPGREEVYLDLTPLARMPLERLEIVTRDLTPLSGMPLKHLNIHLSKVSSLEPLRGMPLETLTCDFTYVSDLSPLTGMPLRSLNVSHTKVKDLHPVRACPIEMIYLVGLNVKDLSALASMPLKHIDLQRSPVTDLSDLSDLPIESIVLSESNVTDVKALTGLPIKSLSMPKTQISDLSPLHGMPLTHLNFARTQVTDLSPLEGSSLNEINLFGCWIKDFAPLATMPNLDREQQVAIPFLIGADSELQFREKMKQLGSSHGQDADTLLHSIVIYVAMRRYSEHGPAAAIPLLEQYAEKWGTTTPPYGRKEFVQESLERLRNELTAQSKETSPTDMSR